MEAVQHIPIEDREAFKYALGATLVKNNAHWRAFETVFEVYFSLRGPQYKLIDGDDDATSTRCGARCRSSRARARAPAGGGMDSLTPEEIAQHADAGADERRPGDDAGAGPPGRAALRRHGARPARSAARTTCTARCATSTSTACSRS